MEGALVCRTCVESGRVQVGLTPFDRREELGIVSAAWKTLIAICAQPKRFFSELAPSGRMGSAILFVIFVSIPAGIMSSLYNLGMKWAIGPIIEPSIRQIYGPEGGPLSDMMVKAYEPSILSALFGAVAFPFILILYAMIAGLVVHLGLLILGGAHKGLEASLKVSLYSHGLLFWVIVPLVGGFAWLWMAVVLGIGLAAIHGAKAWQAVIALLYAPCLAVCCLIGGSVALGVLIGAAASGGGL
jgi:hypothetical protein